MKRPWRALRGWNRPAPGRNGPGRCPHRAPRSARTPALRDRSAPPRTGAWRSPIVSPPPGPQPPGDLPSGPRPGHRPSPPRRIAPGCRAPRPTGATPPGNRGAALPPPPAGYGRPRIPGAGEGSGPTPTGPRNRRDRRLRRPAAVPAVPPLSGTPPSARWGWPAGAPGDFPPGGRRGCRHGRRRAPPACHRRPAPGR